MSVKTDFVLSEEKIDEDLTYLSDKQRRLVLFWLQKKTLRDSLSDRQQGYLFQKAELNQQLLKAFKDDTFEEFDKAYKEKLLAEGSKDHFREKTEAAVQTYMEAKTTLAELVDLSIASTEDEMKLVIYKVLKDEAKTDWYQDFINTCEESMVLQKLYPGLFGEKVTTADAVKHMEPKTPVRFILADGASPEPGLFVKAVYDVEKGQYVNVFAHLDKDKKMEYFTVSPEEAAMIPLCKAGGLSPSAIRLKTFQAMDFSDDLYLAKPSASDIAEAYEKDGRGNSEQFQKLFEARMKAFDKNKQWAIGKGETGKEISEASAAAKFKVFSMQMEQYCETGSYALPLSTIREIVKQVDTQQQQLSKKATTAMRLDYAAREKLLQKDKVMSALLSMEDMEATTDLSVKTEGKKEKER